MTRAWLIILAAILVVLLVWLGIVVRKVNAVPGGREASKPAARDADGPAGIDDCAGPNPSTVAGVGSALPGAGSSSSVIVRAQPRVAGPTNPPSTATFLGSVGESGPCPAPGLGLRAYGASAPLPGRVMGGCACGGDSRTPATPARPTGQPPISLPSDALWRAQCFVESRNNPRAYNAVEQAAGVVQIRPICLEDANRIRRAAERKASDSPSAWTLEDRFDPAQARRIWLCYLTYYGEQYRLATGKPPTDEVFARIWNGNPMRGWKQKATLVYWHKVKEAMQ